MLSKFNKWRCLFGKRFEFKWGAVGLGLWIDRVAFEVPLVPYTYYLGDQRCLKIAFWIGVIGLDVDVFLKE